MIEAIDSEKVLLAAVLLDNDAWYDASATVEVGDFYLDSHQRIWRLAGQMLTDGHPVDAVTLVHQLIENKELNAIGGASYIADLTLGVPRRPSVQEHARRVKKASQQRQMVSLCEEAQTAAEEKSPEQIAAELEAGMERILSSQQESAEIARSLVSTMNRFHAERQLTEGYGLSYGIPNLDSFTGGMRRGEVTVVGARSGVGKTSLACQAIAANAQRGVPVCFFSLEMNREQIDKRLLSIASGVPYRHLVNPWESSAEEAQRVTEASARIAEWPVYVYDADDMTLARMLALSRIAIRRHGVRLIVVDYAQEVDAPGRDERSKVMLTCRKLTRLVKHEDCSLLLLSQLVKLSRENYGKPPIVSDLIESGKLENVAHCVVLLHRSWDEQRRRIAEDAELIIPKQRRGETGVLKARFNRTTATFEEIEPYQRERY